MAPTGNPGSLRVAHRITLAAIALLAVLCALQPMTDQEPAPDPTHTAVAFGLGVGIILLRRAATSPVLSDGTRLALALCAYACAIGLAALGAQLAMNAGQTRTGLAFALASGILCLRPLAATPAARPS